MKTVNELKKLPTSKLREAIDLDVINTRKARETELNASYLKGHPDIEEIPDFIISSNEEYALHYAIGSLQSCLTWTIFRLQEAEAEIHAYKQQEYHQ